jgi:hypothetical protein
MSLSETARQSRHTEPVRGGPSQGQTAFVRDTVHQKLSEREMFCKAGGGNLKFFQNFQKIENMLEIVQNAHKTKTI